MKYYLMNNGAQQSGPFELNDLLGNGLTPQSYVWNETMSNWLPAMHVPEVAAMLNTQQCPSMPVNNAKEVGFSDALGICFKKYATFTGRARRSEYWWFFLWYCILTLFTCGLAAIVLFIPSISATFRRLHDTGRSGWWWGVSMCLGTIYNVIYYIKLYSAISDYGIPPALSVFDIAYYIVSLVYGIVIFVFLVQDSQAGVNKYGPSPKYN